MYELKEKEQPDLVRPADKQVKKFKRGATRAGGVSNDEITEEKITDFNGKEIAFQRPNMDKVKNPFYQKIPIQTDVDDEIINRKV